MAYGSASLTGGVNGALTSYAARTAALKLAKCQAMSDLRTSIDLWVLPLRPREADEALLDERERARLQRLRVAEKRRQLLAAQADLRRVLGRYRERPPEQIRFAYGPHGKPWLPEDPDLGFNLSHSAQLAVVAVGRGLEIGVDLEHVARERAFLRLARRYFDAAEHAWLEGRPEATRAADFYRIWTLKEAYLKAIGTGLTVPPASFRIDLERDPPALATTHDGDDADAWRLLTPAVAESYAVAVCWRGESRTIRRREPRSRA